MTYRMTHLVHQIPRWVRYLIGKSQLHPTISATRSPSTLKRNEDYICDLSAKSKWLGELDQFGVPMNQLYDGTVVYFPIGIVQKLIGLIQTGANQQEIAPITNWICASIDHNDSIPTWTHASDRVTSVYSAMTQGQAISALIRVSQNYPELSKQADVHIIRLCNGFLQGDQIGINLPANKGMKLLETPDKQETVILNGWCYAIWGLIEAANWTRRDDIISFTKDSLEELIDSLPDFYDSQWSYYDDKGRIASSFYHNLHITQLMALYAATNRAEFLDTANILKKQASSRFLKTCALIKKGKQKITEKPYKEFKC